MEWAMKKVTLRIWSVLEKQHISWKAYFDQMVKLSDNIKQEKTKTVSKKVCAQIAVKTWMWVWPYSLSLGLLDYYLLGLLRNF